MKKFLVIISGVLTCSLISLTVVNAVSINNFPEGQPYKIENKVKREVSFIFDYEIPVKTNSQVSGEVTTSSNDSSTTLTGTGTYSSLSFTDDEIRYLANLVESETSGRGELTGEPTKCAAMNVCSVALNRVLSADFPNTVYDVIVQRSQFTGMSKKVNRTDYASDAAYAAVKKTIEFGDTTGGCQYFLNEAIAGHPSWLNNLTYCFKDNIGHTFYKK